MKRILKVIDKIRGDKEFFGWIAAIVIGTITALGWFSANFVTTARAEEMMKVAKTADDLLAGEIKGLAISVKESNKLLAVHMAKGDLNDVMLQIKDNQTQTFNIGQFTRVNGMDSQSEARLQQLESELDALEIKRGCIITKNPLCD
jgi:uncharacterized protein involved in exopolysaccharide biosynthesis